MDRFGICHPARAGQLIGTEPNRWVFILFYGLDWVAAVPPTVALCRRYFGSAAPIVFGWAAPAPAPAPAPAIAGAGWIRDVERTDDRAFYLAAELCIGAGLLRVRDPPRSSTGWVRR